VSLSIIIPTRNRGLFLKEALDSILSQTLGAGEFEILVIDNGSTDITAEIAKEFIAKSNQIRYFFVSEPGLHVGRHLGAQEAKGEILVYVDDDIIATSGWVKAIKDAFNDPKIALVGGKILPKWEGDVPDWINLFKSEVEYGWTIGYLSLLDFGDVLKEIPAYYVYGCNFSIRKSVLYECGGFHPDSMPQELIRYRGDGETALSLTVTQKGYKAIYEPKATVYHRVPPERLTIDYFCRRAFNQGISDSYTEIRQKHGLGNIGTGNSQKTSLLSKILKKVLQLFMYWKTKLVSEQYPIEIQIRKVYEEGKTYHREQVAEDPKLLEYVLKDKYY
jgi:glycosyltransferase involved in cell wall biosynthesis